MSSVLRWTAPALAIGPAIAGAALTRGGISAGPVSALNPAVRLDRLEFDGVAIQVVDERYVREWLGAMVTGGRVAHGHEVMRARP